MGEPIVATLSLDDQLTQPLERASTKLVGTINRAATALEELAGDTRTAASADQELVEGTQRASTSLSNSLPSLEAAAGGFEQLEMSTVAASTSLTDGFSNALAGTRQQADSSGESIDNLRLEMDELFDGLADVSDSLEDELTRAIELAGRESQETTALLADLRAGLGDVESSAVDAGQALEGEIDLNLQGLEASLMETSQAAETAGESLKTFGGDVSLSVADVVALGGDINTLARSLDELDDESEQTAATLRDDLAQAFGLSDADAEALRRELVILRQGMQETETETRDTASVLERVFGGAVQFAEDLLVSVRRELNRFGNELDAFGDEARDSAGNVDRMNRAVESLKTGVTASVGVITGATTALALFANQTARNRSELVGLSRDTGLTVEELSRLQFAAERNGLEAEEVGEALLTLSERIGEAAVFGGEAGEAFDVLGINLRNTDGTIRSTNDLLPELADTLGQVESQTLRVALSRQIFGDEEAKLIRVLSVGSQGLRELGEESDRLGITVRDKAARESKLFRQELSITGQTIVAAGRNIIDDYIPSLTAILPPLREWVVGLQDSALVNQTLAPLLNTSVEILGFIAENLRLVEAGWAAVNVAFNLTVAGFATGLDTILVGVEQVLSGLSAIAASVGFENIADQLDDDAQAIIGLQENLRSLSSVATETAAEWAEEFDKNVKQPTEDINDELDKTKDKLKAVGQSSKDAADEVSGQSQQISNSLLQIGGTADPLGELFLAGLQPVLDANNELIESFGRTADGFITNIPNAVAQGSAETIQNLQPIITTIRDIDGNVVSVTDNFGFLGPSAMQAGSQAAAGLQQSNSATEDGIQAAVDLNAAYFKFGVESQEKLEETATNNIRDFNRIRESGTASARTLGEIWVDQVAPSIIRAYGRIPPEFAGLNATIIQDARNTTDSTTRAFENLGVSVEDITDRTASEVVSDFALIRIEASNDAGLIKDAFINGTDEIIRIQGRIPPNWETIGNQLVAKGVLTAEELESAFGQAGDRIGESLQMAADEGESAFDRLVREGRSAAAALAELQFGFDTGRDSLTAGNRELIEGGVEVGTIDLSASTDELERTIDALNDALRGTTGASSQAQAARDTLNNAIREVLAELSRREQESENEQLRPPGTNLGGQDFGNQAGDTDTTGGVSSRPSSVDVTDFGAGPVAFQDQSIDALRQELVMLSERLQALREDPSAALANAGAITDLNAQISRLRDEITRRERERNLAVTEEPRPAELRRPVVISGPGPSTQDGGVQGGESGDGETRRDDRDTTRLNLTGEDSSLLIGSGQDQLTPREREALDELERTDSSGISLRRQTQIVGRDEDQALSNLTTALEENTEVTRERESTTTIMVTVQANITEQVPDARTMVRALGPELEEAVRRREINLEGS